MRDLGIVNVAVQVLPLQSEKHPYSIVDKAIELIHNSGLKYEVGPFETVIEGQYDEVMSLVKKLQIVCLEEGARQVITNLKIQASSNMNVSMTDKIEKYR